jgi:hypothetical protein
LFMFLFESSEELRVPSICFLYVNNISYASL